MSDAHPAPNPWQAMDRLFQTTLVSGTNSLGEVLDRRVELVWQARMDGNPAFAGLLRAAEHHGEAAGRGLTREDVRTVIANEHGFADWAAVAAHGDLPVDPDFEAAGDAIVAGDLDALRILLDARPELARARSPFGHHATLLHYVAANGVERSRQWQSPRNAVEILRILLRYGGDPDAVCDSYGGGSAITPLCMLVSSRHPADAGVQAGLVEELCRGGAAPDGLDEDGIPLWTAITSGYPLAVDALARCGARVDNLVFAAAVGDLPRVREYLPGGRPTKVRERSVQGIGIRGPRLDPDHLVEYALIYSSGLGRRAVVEFLLTKNPDLSVIEPMFHSTAVGMARYHHRDDIVALFEGS